MWRSCINKSFRTHEVKECLESTTSLKVVSLSVVGISQTSENNVPSYGILIVIDCKFLEKLHLDNCESARLIEDRVAIEREFAALRV